MAKKGLELKNLTAYIKSRCNTSGWAICIGAGTSTPAFPNWKDLVEKLITKDGVSDSIALLSNLSETYNYDALIQSAKDRLGLNDEDFAKVLVEELYSKVKATFSKSEWKLFTKAMSSTQINDLSKTEWKDFLKLIEKYYSGMSVLQISKVVSEIIQKELSPSAIMSFNAEPLLFTLINAFSALRFAESNKVMDLITHGVSDRRANRLAFYFCHGLLPVPDTKQKKHNSASLDKLVFSETNYLQLANSAFSWQSSVFLDICSSRSVVFIGLSLSDPNMRKWLSWIYANRIQELRSRGSSVKESTSHFWINKKPTSENEVRWIESVVAHLGVRLIWISDWSEVEQALRLLLGK